LGELDTKNVSDKVRRDLVKAGLVEHTAKCSWTPSQRTLLLGFDLDMDIGILTMTFSEAINASSLNVNEITIQASQDGNGTSWRLNDGPPPFGSITESDDTAIIEIKLGTTDLNAIKWYTDLATNEDNTFVSLTSLSFRDMNKNSVEDVPFDNATIVCELYHKS